MIGDRLTKHVSVNSRRLRLKFFEGILIDDLLRFQTEAVAYEYRANRKGAFMQLIPKAERDRLIRLGVESR